MIGTFEFELGAHFWEQFNACARLKYRRGARAVLPKFTWRICGSHVVTSALEGNSRLLQLPHFQESPICLYLAPVVNDPAG